MTDMRMLIDLVEQVQLDELAPRGKLKITPGEAMNALDIPAPSGDDFEVLDDPFTLFRRILLDRGFKVHGEGSFGIVFSDPGMTYVIKLFNIENDSGYVAFLQYCDANKGNPHLPVFRGKPTLIQGDYYWNRIEALEPMDDEQRYIVSDIYDYLESCRARRSKVTMKGLAEYTDADFVQAAAQHGFGAEFFATLMGLQAGARRNSVGMDFHTENVMARKDGTPVIIDPYSSAKFVP